MYKTCCIFDHNEIETFYNKIGKKIEFDNITMFFALYEDDELVATIKLQPEDGNCRLFEVEKMDKVDEECEEFLFKSTVNFALTVNAKYLVCNVARYERYLLPMHFEKKGNEYYGDINVVDFPHDKCNKIS